MKTLIIEDELPAAKQLTRLLYQHDPSFTIMETLDSVEGAVRWLRVFPAPELIFMDIQIADGLSFDIFRQVNLTSPVIFTTAFDQYAIQAFKVNAIDYLLKPVDPEDLARALKKVRGRGATDTPSFGYEKLLQYFEKTTYKDRFLVKTGQYFVMLPVIEIAFFRSSDGLTQAYTHEGKKHFVEFTLDELERVIDPSCFFRVSRSIIISTGSVKAIHPHLNGRLKIDTHPKSQEEIFVSRDRAGEFKAWLGG
jgi:two-component system response regulator LytT